MLTLGVVLEALGGIQPEKLEREVLLKDQIHAHQAELLNQPITGGVIDSREAHPGGMFIALPGENVDGHDYVPDAFERGALLAIIQHELQISAPVINLRVEFGDEHSTLLVENLLETLSTIEIGQAICILVNNSLAALQKVAGYWRSKLNVRVIGITGSVGKSTTKELIADVLSQRYPTLKNPGNMNNEIGLPLTLLSLTEAHERAVLEMGFYVPGEIALLCELSKPVIGVITNIGTVHAERAGSQEAIARGKAELVEALPPAPRGIAILNYDDPLVRGMANQTKARIFYYGLSPEAKLWADEVESLGLDGISFRLHYRREVLYLHVPLIGRHSVHTVLRAAAVGLIEGLTWQEIVNGLRSERTQLRLVTVRSRQGAMILDDTYNASPESTLAALNLLEELDVGTENVPGRKIAVLGDMLELGIYEKMGHEEVGARAAEVVDELVTIGERGKLIANAAWQAGLSKKKISSYSNNQQAITYLLEHLIESDIVLVKGSRGMLMDQIVTALEAQP
ncbi:MAG: murF [Chloroflexi bacterium]|nr:murF [Chloroflexota bacterium]